MFDKLKEEITSKKSQISKNLIMQKTFKKIKRLPFLLVKAEACLKPMRASITELFC